jgi:hypothetical protein
MVTWQGSSAPRAWSSTSFARRSSPEPADGPDGNGESLPDAVGMLGGAEIEEAESALGLAAEPDATEHERLRAERLRADFLMVEAVLEQGLGGPRHRALEDALITYAGPVLQYLLANGRLVSKATRLGAPPAPADAWLDFTEDDRQEFAQEMIATALPRFTRAVFEQRRWTPDRGASLKTYFVNACILQFARLQGQWLAHRKAIRPAGLEIDPDAFAPTPDPAATVVLQDEVHRVLSQVADDQLREVIVLRGAGWSAEDAAREAGLTTKAAEGRLARVRKNFKDERAATEPHGTRRPDAQGGR